MGWCVRGLFVVPPFYFYFLANSSGFIHVPGLIFVPVGGRSILEIRRLGSNPLFSATFCLFLLYCFFVLGGVSG